MNLETLPPGVRMAVEAAQEKKAAAITVLDLSGAGAFTDYFVICTGFSTPQVQAICTEIEERLYKKLGRSPQHREGERSAEWALLDFGGFVVHVFAERARRYYDLERLWRSAPKLEIPDESGGSSAERKLANSSFGRNSFSGEVVSDQPHTSRTQR